jgi:hypothetical protein
MAMAVALLLLFNAASPRSWTAQLPPGEAALTARRWAEDWWRATARLGLNAPRAAVETAWREALAARFPLGRRVGETPREPPPDLAPRLGTPPQR